MKTVELKNVVPLVMKNMWNSVNSLYKNMPQVCKIMFKEIAPVLFECFLKALE